MTDQETLVAFSPSARLATPEGPEESVIASVHVHADGAVHVIVDTAAAEHLALLTLPAGSLVREALAAPEVAA